MSETISIDTETLEEIENSIAEGVNGESIHDEFEVHDGVFVEIEIDHHEFNNGDSEAQVGISVLIDNASRFTPDNMLGYPPVLDDLGDMGDTLAAELEGAFRNGSDTDYYLLLDYHKGFNGDMELYTTVMPLNVNLA